MKYVYLYQTRDNENRQGEIRAANRAEAYAALRRQGIKPYRLIGDDPSPWRKRLIWIVNIAAVLLILAAVVYIFWNANSSSPAYRPSPRSQITGNAQVIAKGVADCWEDVFTNKLDRFLAAYAQPGWVAAPPLITEDEYASLADELTSPLERNANEGEEERQIKNIVLSMRQEMKEHLESGGTVEDFLEFLEERQSSEVEFREKARETLERALPSMRERAWANLNIRLKDRNIAPLPPL